MKITIVGPGALGCLIAGMIKHRAKEDVWVLDHLPERAKKLSANGIKIDGHQSPISVKISATTGAAKIGICDLVVICVKSYSTEEICKSIKGLVGNSTNILTMQNGIGNLQILNEFFSSDKIIGAVTNHGATLIGVGHTRHAGKGQTIIGRQDGRVLGAVRDISNLLSKSGFESKVTKDIDSAIWSKLIINTGINALTAITRLPNGVMVSADGPKNILRSAVQEAIKVVKRKKVKLAYDDPIQKVETVCKSTASNVSSMLQDVINKKRTEIDFINGAIVRQAKALGINTPINEALTALVNTIESTYDKTISEK